MTEPQPAFSPDQLLAAVGQAIVATDLHDKIVYWNAAAERLYGWKASEVLGDDVTDVIVPHMSLQKAADIMASLRDGRPWAGGFTVQRRDGSTFPALVTASGVYHDGELVGLVGVSANLGTALRPLLERSADAALVLNDEGTVTYASPAVDPLFGWQPDDLIGKPLATFLDSRDHDELFRVLHQPDAPLGEVLEVGVQAARGPTIGEAVFTDLRDDPVVRGLVCNLRYSERAARLRERERISQAAHADILQTLFGATLDLAAAQAAATTGEHANVESAGTKIREAIAALRRLLDSGDSGDSGTDRQDQAPH